MAPPRKTIEQILYDTEELLRRKNLELNKAQQLIKQLQREEDTAESIRQKIFEIASHDPQPPKGWRLTQKEVPAGERGGPIVVWSDIHYGETVSVEEVGGVNKYNKTIAATRMQRLYDTTVDLCFNHMGRAQRRYPGIVVCLGGDMVGGDIHEELQDTNDRTPQQAIDDLTDILCAGIEQMGSKFGRVRLPCVVGNHGRSTKRPRAKTRVFYNHDWSIYCNLKRAFRQSKHIEFLIPGESDAYFEVFGHRYLLTHGDTLGVKGGDGIIGALGPIMRGAIKVHRSEAQIGRDFDTAIVCHWHQYITLPGLIVNNSVKGYDEFTKNILRAPYARPSQALWFTHPEHGITAHWQVYLEGRKKFARSNEWVRWMTHAAN
jgi:hypothetical protein